jgi:Mn2+/Fe2+ NRAMP family transporter
MRTKRLSWSSFTRTKYHVRRALPIRVVVVVAMVVAGVVVMVVVVAMVVAGVVVMVVVGVVVIVVSKKELFYQLKSHLHTLTIVQYYSYIFFSEHPT